MKRTSVHLYFFTCLMFSFLARLFASLGNTGICLRSHVGITLSGHTHHTHLHTFSTKHAACVVFRVFSIFFHLLVSYRLCRVDGTFNVETMREEIAALARRCVDRANKINRRTQQKCLLHWANWSTRNGCCNKLAKKKITFTQCSMEVRVRCHTLNGCKWQIGFV